MRVGSGRPPEFVCRVIDREEREITMGSGVVSSGGQGSAGSRKNRKGRPGVRIDMTPMVDIAFLLLIFYMSTTQFKPLEARPVDLPASHSQIELPERDIITVTITRLDSVFVDWVQRTLIEIDGHSAYSMVRFVQPADRYTVASWINKARGNNDRALVVLKTDRDASFGITQDIIRSMQLQKVNRFLIITEPESDRQYATHIIG